MINCIHPSATPHAALVLGTLEDHIRSSLPLNKVHVDGGVFFKQKANFKDWPRQLGYRDGSVPRFRRVVLKMMIAHLITLAVVGQVKGCVRPLTGHHELLTREEAWGCQ